MGRDLQQPWQSRVDFLDLISHELRQPLSGAYGSLATVVGRTTQLTEAARERLLEIALRNLVQLEALVDRLCMFSEADKGWSDLDRETLSVEEFFRQIVEDYPDSRTERKLTTHCPRGLTVQADKILFQQLITNLVGNAIKFSPAGSTIALKGSKRGGKILITVENDGVGFPPTERERIFEKAVRLVPSSSGLGLGLYVSRAIVEAHGGHIRATGAPRRGAKFEISLPA